MAGQCRPARLSGRLAHLLCEMGVRTSRSTRPARSFFFPITQEQLADALGLTSVHVNRTLKALRDEGLVRLTRSEVRIDDWDALVSAAEFDPAYLCLPAEGGGARMEIGR